MGIVWAGGGVTRQHNPVFQSSLFSFLPKYSFKLDLFIWGLSIYSPAVGSSSTAVKYCSVPWPCAGCLQVTQHLSTQTLRQHRFPQMITLVLLPASHHMPCLSLHRCWFPWERVINPLYCHLLKWSIVATKLAAGIASWLAPKDGAFATAPACLGSVYLFTEICFSVNFPHDETQVVKAHSTQKSSLCLQQREEKRADNKPSGNRGEEATVTALNEATVDKKTKCEQIETTAIISKVLTICQALLLNKCTNLVPHFTDEETELNLSKIIATKW